MAKLKILMLHGFGQNAKVFEKKTGYLRKALKDIAVCVFINAPFELDESERITREKEDLFQAEDEQLAWFKREDNVYHGVDESVSYLCKFIQDSGPFDGIFGFSQGAAMASTLSILIEKKHEKVTENFPNLSNFKFNIFAGAFLPRDPTVASYLEPKSDIPTLHIIGEKDGLISPEWSDLLVEKYNQSTKLIHDGGHFLPSKAQYKRDIVNFIRQFQKAETNEQNGSALHNKL